jgi:hypothetical protein
MKKRLEKLKMPPKKSGKIDVAAMEADESAEKPGEEDLESPEYQAAEDKYGIEKHDDSGNPEGAEDQEGSPAEEQMESAGEESAESGPLAHVDDEELLAEIKKRGLMDQLQGSGDEYGAPQQDGQDGSSKY